ncbi:MAG: MFS transporter [Magnetococcales bacterium]|nr:MFS transporter [Magnetococcales bacterium]NGZ28169.1 MFS transporter [Magnetococcales bacterium]
MDSGGGLDRRTYWILASLYALHFGVLGIWIPYWPLYLAGLGLSLSDIGLLTSVSQGIKVLGPLIWGRLADRGERKRVFILSSLFTWITFCLYLAGSDFTFLLLVTLLYSISTPVSLIDTIAMDVVQKRGGQYGRIRLWGSISFILFAMALGPVTERWGLSTVLWSIALLLFLAVLLALFTPDEQTHRPHDATAPGWLKQKGVVWFMIGSFFMQFSHGAYYGFMSLHLEENGYSKTVIGLLWSLGVIAEVAVMHYAQHVLARYSLSRVLSFSIATAWLRWSLYALTIWQPLLLFGQTLHAFTFGAYHIAAMQRVHQTAPLHGRATAQALYGSLSFGLGGSLGLLASGSLYHAFGATAMFSLMALAAFLGWLASLRAGRVFDLGVGDANRD